jgi:ParB/RepB/Spo0J family partition protein
VKIGIWSDAVHFPNLPLMKLSTYHKAQGDTVEHIAAGGHYDKVYLSKTFFLPQLRNIPQEQPPFFADMVVKGGTGYAIRTDGGKEMYEQEDDTPLPPEIENLCPDYSLYPDRENAAYGFLTRGCPNNCKFCIVTQKEGTCSRQVANTGQFWRGQSKIRLLDPNLLACRDRESILKELIATKARIDFTQGLDARLMTEDIAQLINRMKLDMVHFAFDNVKHESSVIRGLETFKKHYKGGDRNLRVYVLTNFDSTLTEDWHRVCAVRKCSYYPYVMIYQKGTHPQFLTDLARWANNPRLYRTTDFGGYIPRTDGRACKDLYPEILRNERIITMAGFNLGAMTSQANSVKQIPIDLLMQYRNHKFKLYDGERLQDMVDSIKANGILNPILVRPSANNTYEILSGHNRSNAAKLAGLTAVPGIVKENLTDEEAEMYVIETNLLQRGFADLRISEQAAAVAMEYDKERLFSKEKREAIRAEILSEGGSRAMVAENSEHKTPSDKTGDSYGLCGRQVLRLMRINKLPALMKNWVDEGNLSLRAGVELSYIDGGILDTIMSICSEGVSDEEDNAEMLYKIDIQTAKTLREAAKDKPNRKYLKSLILNRYKPETKSVKISKRLYSEYFTGKSAEEVNDIVEKAVKAYMK